jgi:hypothetical protein
MELNNIPIPTHEIKVAHDQIPCTLNAFCKEDSGMTLTLKVNQVLTEAAYQEFPPMDRAYIEILLNKIADLVQKNVKK